MLASGITSQAFNNAVSSLNKINDYCSFEHIQVINIREKVSEFRRVKTLGKKVFIEEYKPPYSQAFSEEEARQILRYVLDNPNDNNLAIACLITTGLRLGELLALTVSDLDIEGKSLSVIKAEKNKKPYEIITPKEYSYREVYLSSDAVMFLSMSAKGKDKSDWLFFNGAGNKLHAKGCDKRIRRIQRTLGLDERFVRSCHDCRRTYASIAYKNGMDIMTICRQLGHRNLKQTYDYIKDIISQEERAKEADKSSILN